MLSANRLPRAVRLAASSWLVPLCFGLGGCLDSGGIELALQFPADTTLAPDADAVAEVSLLYWESGQSFQRITRSRGALDDAPFELEPGQVLRMAVELYSSTQRLIGFGRVEQPVEIGADGGSPIRVEMRRPFVYLGSDSGIDAMDATQEVSGGLPTFFKRITLPAPARVAVPSYDGKYLVAVVSRPEVPGDVDGALLTDLHVLDTSSHTASASAPVGPIRLRAAAADLALSSDGKYAVVAHEQDGDDPGGLSIVDLDAARAGQVVVTPVFLQGPVGRLSAGLDAPDRVFALMQRIDRLDCLSPISTIYEISLPSGAIAQTIPLDVPVQDLAAADDGSFLVVADSCRNTLWRVPARGTGGIAAFGPSIPQVSSVALWNNAVWTVTSQPKPDERTQPGGTRIEVISLDLQGNVRTRIELPPMQLDVEVPVFSDEGQVAGLQVAADGIYAYDLAVAPGAGAIALLLENTYFVQERIVNDNTFIPDMDIRTIDYLLVDITTATLVQQALNGCEILQLEPALINNYHCAQAPNPDARPEITHEPRGISVLYGSR
jgi:hypothetical protein